MATNALVGLASTQQFIGFGEVPKNLGSCLGLLEKIFLGLLFCCTEFALLPNDEFASRYSLSLSLHKCIYVFVSAGSRHIGINHTLKI